MVAMLCICGNQLRLPESAIGRSGKCPFCGRTIRLVAPSFQSAAGPLRCRLMVKDGPRHAGEQFVLGGPGPIEVGKLPGKDIILSGQKISRSHCRLVATSTGWCVEDQGSRNGTHVNGTRVTSQELRDGDQLRLGEYLLRYMTTIPAAAQAAGQRTAVPASAVPAAAAAVAQRQDDAVLFIGEPDQDCEDDSLQPDRAPKAPEPEADGEVCPSCRKRFPKAVKICVACGVDLRTRRVILTSQEDNLAAAESVVRFVSWLLPFGIAPVASEALGIRRPWFTWSIAILTSIISVWFWTKYYKPEMQELKNYQLWCGNTPADAERIEGTYAAIDYRMIPRYGDPRAFKTAVNRLEREKAAARRIVAWPALAKREHQQAVLAAHQSLTPEQQCFGKYRPSQLVTNVFQHSGRTHLVGNMIFLLVLGCRVNALIGNVAAGLAYFALAIAASLAMVITSAQEMPTPCIGASGPIMGLAGMYFVLMPLHKVHMGIWLRLILLLQPFKVVMKIFGVRGFWVVLVYIAFDVSATVLGTEDNVAHWAHLGGFIAGMALGFVLLAARLVNCRGGDLLSGLLGRHAWAIVGKPNPDRKAPLQYLP